MLVLQWYTKYNGNKEDTSYRLIPATFFFQSDLGYIILHLLLLLLTIYTLYLKHCWVINIFPSFYYVLNVCSALTRSSSRLPDTLFGILLLSSMIAILIVLNQKYPKTIKLCVRYSPYMQLSKFELKLGRHLSLPISWNCSKG